MALTATQGTITDAVQLAWTKYPGATRYRISRNGEETTRVMGADTTTYLDASKQGRDVEAGNAAALEKSEGAAAQQVTSADGDAYKSAVEANGKREDWYKNAATWAGGEMPSDVYNAAAQDLQNHINKNDGFAQLAGKFGKESHSIPRSGTARRGP